ncbi:MAG TPA: TlpA disulfide reductase family protein [Candidatus Omnitrophota bacterium]|nr:TlpA disulfide reductase family protein [Candidatus Omnitrophota bacterium]
MAAVLAATPCIAAELPSVGNLPPAITLPNTDGHIVNLSDFHGKPVIVTFFVSWSDACREQLGALNELALRYPRSIGIVAVSLDKKVKGLKELVAGLKLGFSPLIDKKLTSLNDYSVLTLPTTFTIGADGRIKGVFVDFDDNVKRSLSDFARSQISPTEP